MKKTVMLVACVMALLAPLAAQTVTVTSPNGGESWALHSSHAITWTPTNPGNVKVDIILRNTSGKVGAIKSQVSLSSGSWQWQDVGKLENGTMVAPGTDYIVRIRDAGNTFSDDSDAVFTLSGSSPPPGNTPTLQLLSPNGGENWGKGQAKNITWTAANWTGTIKLELLQNGALKGMIATGVPSSPGSYSWPVGNFTNGSSAGIGGDYKVRVVREYKAGPHSPMPLSPLMDESDGSFIISFPAMPDSKTDVRPIKVITPKEGDIFTYGPYIGPNTYGISMNIQWETRYSLPFLIELYDNGGKKLWDMEVESEVISQKLSSTNLYSLKYLFVPENSSPGWYKIRVLSSDGHQSGFSGKFRIREVKVLEETIPAEIDNHYHSESTDYSFGHLFSGGTKTQFQNLSAKARVGFENKYETESAGQYAYLGYVFRSRLTANLDRFKNLKGKFLNADLYIERKEHYNNYQNGINLCGDKLYVLSGPWGKNNVMETPGVLLQSLSQSLIGQHIDVTNWFNAWLSGQSPNYGLLLTALSESFNHENNWCVSYFHVVFNTKFQTEE